MGGILDRLAAAETYPELVDLPKHQAFKGFKKVHVGVGTSDLSEEVASFWYLDTEEILHFSQMMGVFAFLYTLMLWVDLGYMMNQTTGRPPLQGGLIEGTPAYDFAVEGAALHNPQVSNLGTVLRRYGNPGNQEDFVPILCRVHHVGAVAGWTLWFLVALSVALYQFWVAHFSEPNLVRRNGDSPWIPRHNHGPGIKKVPIYETKPRAFCFFAPIRTIQDGNCLYAHSELIDDVVFGDTVPEKLKKCREVWKDRLKRWYPPSISDGFDWALARRAIVEDAFGSISKPRPVPGRYFIDEESSTSDDITKGKELRRLLWMLMWVPTILCGLTGMGSIFLSADPKSFLILVPLVIVFGMSIFILWFQFGKWGAKKLEMWDREKEESLNPFSKHGSREN